MTPDVLALDLSLTGTGWATHHSHYGIQVGTIGTTGLAGHTRTQRIMLGIDRHMRVIRPHIVMVETLPPAAGRMGNSLVDLAMLHGVVRYYLAQRGVPTVLIEATKLKVFATGVGRGDKVAVSLAVERRYGKRVAIADDNQADALVLLAMALHHYGAPLAPLPNTHTRALAGVTWPTLPEPQTAQSADLSLDLRSADRASNQEIMT